MRFYWLRSPTGWRRSPSLDVIERAVEQLPQDAAWWIEVEYPGGRRRPWRSGVGPRRRVA